MINQLNFFKLNCDNVGLWPILYLDLVVTTGGRHERSFTMPTPIKIMFFVFLTLSYAFFCWLRTYVHKITLKITFLRISLLKLLSKIWIVVKINFQLILASCEISPTAHWACKCDVWALKGIQTSEAWWLYLLHVFYFLSQLLHLLLSTPESPAAAVRESRSSKWRHLWRWSRSHLLWFGKTLSWEEREFNWQVVLFFPISHDSANIC